MHGTTTGTRTHQDHAQPAHPPPVPLGMPRAPLWVLTASTRLPPAAAAPLPAGPSTWAPRGPQAGPAVGAAGGGGGELKPSCSRITRLPEPASWPHRSRPRPPRGEGTPPATSRLPSLVHSAAGAIGGRGGAQRSRGHGRPPRHTAGPTCSPPPLQAAPVLDLRPGSPCFQLERLPGPPSASGPARPPAWGPTAPREAAACRSIQAKQQRPWRQA